MERRTYVHTTPFHTSEVYRYARDEGFEQAEHFFVKTGKVRDTWCDLPSAHVKTSSMEVYFPWSPTPRMVVVVSIFRVEEDVIEVQGHCEGVGKVHARCTFEAYESGFERTIAVDAVADAAILFCRAHTGQASGLKRRLASRAGGSKGSFGSLTGLDTLARPFPF